MSASHTVSPVLERAAIEEWPLSLEPCGHPPSGGRQAGATVSCWSEPREKTREGFFSPGARFTTSMDAGRRCFLLALGVPAPDGQLCSLSRDLFWALAGHEGLRPSNGSLDAFSL